MKYYVTSCICMQPGRFKEEILEYQKHLILVNTITAVFDGAEPGPDNILNIFISLQLVCVEKKRCHLRFSTEAKWLLDLSQREPTCQPQLLTWNPYQTDGLNCSQH